MVGLAAVAPDGSALGYALVEAQAVEASAVNHARRRGVLHHVCVDATWRGRGLGSALVEEAKAWLRAQGVARLGASYWTFNEASAALMRRAGLRPALIWAEGAA
jgi:GNAT superfamily N-acetyltransferase